MITLALKGARRAEPATLAQQEADFTAEGAPAADLPPVVDAADDANAPAWPAPRTVARIATPLRPGRRR